MTPNKLISQHGYICQTQPRIWVNDSRYSISHTTQVIGSVMKQVKPSPFNFFEIHGAPHPMPKYYIKKLPRFFGNDYVYIEGYLDVFWWYMEFGGVEDEDVYECALGDSLDGDAKLWFDHLKLGSITGHNMFTNF